MVVEARTSRISKIFRLCLSDWSPVVLFGSEMVEQALWMQAESLPPSLHGFLILFLIFFQLAGGVTEGCCQLVPCGMLHLNVSEPTP
jgi:hypothetical protein